MRVLFAVLFLFFSGCEQAAREETNRPKSNLRIVSLDFCADQYVLALAERSSITALSKDATAHFSYLRDIAVGVPTVSSRTEDILLLQPDVVVRTYGGDAGITEALERAGIEVVQIGFVTSLDDIAPTLQKVSVALNANIRGTHLIEATNEKLQQFSPPISNSQTALYLTSKGAAAGRGTIIDQLLTVSGYTNYLQQNGWSTIPLEQLAFSQPDLLVKGFFETNDLTSDLWTPARHPVVRKLLAEKPSITVPGAMTACNAWFIADAVDVLTSKSDEAS